MNVPATQTLSKADKSWFSQQALFNTDCTRKTWFRVLAILHTGYRMVHKDDTQCGDLCHYYSVHFPLCSLHLPSSASQL